MDTLEQAQIPYVGAGRNLEEAEKIVYFIANGRKIAIVAATQIERSYSYTKEATKDLSLIHIRGNERWRHHPFREYTLQSRRDKEWRGFLKRPCFYL